MGRLQRSLVLKQKVHTKICVRRKSKYLMFFYTNAIKFLSRLLSKFSQTEALCNINFGNSSPNINDE